MVKQILQKLNNFLKLNKQSPAPVEVKSLKKLAGPPRVVKRFKLYGSAVRDGLEGAALTLSLTSYPSAVAAYTIKHGGKLIETKKTLGYWEGNPEDAFISVIECTEAEARRIALDLTKAYRQECIAIFSEEFLNADAVAISFKLNPSPEKARAEVDEIRKNFKAFTIKKGFIEVDPDKKTIINDRARVEVISQNPAEVKKLKEILKDLKKGYIEEPGLFSLVSD